MRKIVSARIDKLIVVGGTHGNEIPGLDALKVLKARGSKAELVQGNLAAIDKNVRFIEKDLNRSFGDDDLNSGEYGIELERAREIINKVPFNDRNVVLDLHTTTSMAQNMIILMQGKDDKFNINLAQFVQSRMKLINETPVKIFYFPGENHPYLAPSLSSKGFGIEVGPVAHGLGDYNATKTMVKTVEAVQDFIDQINKGWVFVGEEFANVYQYVSSVKFPQNESESIVIHPDFMGMDYIPLTHDTPIFKDVITGEDIYYDGEDGLCPVFINEAAYTAQGKGIAFHLTRKGRV